MQSIRKSWLQANKLPLSHPKSVRGEDLTHGDLIKLTTSSLMINADRIIASLIIISSLYFMWHAVALPIGWNGIEGGPGGGAFPFWLSVIMLICSAIIFWRSSSGTKFQKFSFDTSMIKPILLVSVSLLCTVGLISFIGAYIAIFLFLFWYLRVIGRHSIGLSLTIPVLTPILMFFFFEVTLKIMLPKGVSEPLFLPLYAKFF